ncbi:pectinesterase family protein [Paenibacillus aurantius]|uniref:Pectinesterase n=1 Tax=Paenibacillus aurantius TaxID=2918900 RepID=A0AA96LJL8_9BACL|nr:pectinesterase family protein [Paenibacillus aurantius]WNQ13306.1 pectinesterase family protein [Paenibacillus aurantius]
MITVAQDGTGDYTSIQEAVDRLPEHASRPRLLYIRNGLYREKLYIDKPYVTLIGESAGGTVIEYSDYALKNYPDGTPYHTFNSYSVFLGGDDFTAENLTFANTAGSGKEVGQAVAAYVDGDRAVSRRCRFTGRQDTLFTGPLPEQPMDRSRFGGPGDTLPRCHVRHLYEECYIEGDVDFIFGSATALFLRCEIHSTGSGWITAASTPEGVEFGYVFLDCRLTGSAPAPSVYLGRPWRNHAQTVFLRCWMGPHIRPEGWDNWNKPESEGTVRYAEAGCTGPGAKPESRVAWSRQLTEEEAQAFTVQGILQGEDSWDPFSAEAQ